MNKIIPLAQLEKYDDFMLELEDLLNKHKVCLIADREENIQIRDIAYTEGSYIALHQTIYRDRYMPSHIYYELQSEVI